MAEIKSKGKRARSDGRFGVRYGSKGRKIWAEVEEKMHLDYECSKCGAFKLKRTDTGIWSCKKCGFTFAGGCYLPQTSAHITVQRAVQSYKLEAEKSENN